MRNAVGRYSIIVFLLLVYINRGLFVVPFETENCTDEETNSIIELAMQLITGVSNDIDEDGDLQNDCNSTKIPKLDFSQQFAQCFELLNWVTKKAEKFVAPNKENFYVFYTQIDHPPQLK